MTRSRSTRLGHVFPGGPARILLAAGVLLAGCGDQGERVPLDRQGSAQQSPVEALPAELQARLDSGNTAYRARDYAEALRHFEEVAREAPDLAAGWYGIGMTQGALGNAEAADSAMMRVHRLAPELPLDHPATAAPRNPHPQIPPGGITPR